MRAPLWCEKGNFDVGVALDGIACQASGQPFEFKTLDELPRDVLWILDASPSEFYLLEHRPIGMAPADFLGEPLNCIQARACLHPKNGDFGRVVQGLAILANRTIVAADRLFGLPAYPLERIPRHLGRWLQPAVIDSERFELRQACAEVFMKDTFNSVITTPAIPAGFSSDGLKGVVPLVSGNRLDGVIERLLDLPVPEGAWEEVPVAHFGQTVAQQISAIRVADDPLLIQVFVADVHSPLTSIVGPNLLVRTRRWMTQAEFSLLSTFGTAVPERVLRADRAVRLPSTLRKPLEPLNSVQKASLSHGLAAQAIQIALSSSVVANGQYLTTSRAAWVASIGRLEVLTRFIQLLAPLGAKLTGYSGVHAGWYCETSRSRMRAIAAASDPGIGFDILVEQGVVK